MSNSRIARLLLLAAACVLALAFSAKGAHAAVLINEFDYDQPGTDAAEFIELVNTDPTNAVSLDNYTVELWNGANNTRYQNIALTGAVIPPGGYYVICANPATFPGCKDVTPDTDWIQNGSPDAVALSLNGVLVDAVSYEGNVPGFTEGTGAGSATVFENNTAPNQSSSRCPNSSDTNNNNADFQLKTPTPGAANDCGGTSAPPLGACGDPATLISAIQGTGSASPIVGSIVVVQGVVSADFQDAPINGFFLQEDAAEFDANPQTSEGLYVFEGALSVPVAAGNSVRVRGKVTEFNTLTELGEVTDVVVCPGSATAATVSLSLPVAAVSDLERYEGMLVNISQTLTVTGNFGFGRFGELDLSANGRLMQPTNVMPKGAPAQALQSLNDRSRIVLDDLSDIQNPNPIPYKDANNTRRLGDTLPSLTGALTSEFSAFRIRPTAPVVFSSGNPRPGTVPASGGRLRVAAMNVLNYFTTLDTGAAICGPSGNLDCRGANTALELNRQREKILNALQGANADVVGLMEVENNPLQAVQDLVNGINTRLGSSAYTLVDTNMIGTDAIKVAFIYKVATVEPAGSFALLTSAVDPNFIDTKNRPSLAQTFRERSTGAKFTAS